MTFTPNVPQGNQTIAATTTPIRNNFGYINTTEQVEHNFNNAPNPAQANGTHLKVSMPNRADPLPGTLPAGTNGMHYVSGGQARYFDGTNVSQLSLGSPANRGYQWIGRVLIQWGFINSTSNGTVTFSAGGGIAFPTNCFNVTTQPKYIGSAPNGAATAAVNVTSNLSFDWSFATNSGAYQGFYWMAVGN